MKFIVRKIDERAGPPGESIQSSLIYFDRLFANDYKSNEIIQSDRIIICGGFTPQKV
jgi:hypothetical protein